LYEYLPKQYLLLGGLVEQYKNMYQSSLTVAKEHIIFRPMTQDGRDVRLSGTKTIPTSNLSDVSFLPEAQHLSCFTGGMVGIGAKIFNEPKELELAQKLTDGCVWLYNSTATGVMPEISHLMKCEDEEACPWDQDAWCSALNVKPGRQCDKEVSRDRLFPGAVLIPDRRYILRPEAIESVFIMYRITGSKSWQEKGWSMFEAITKYTEAPFGAAGLDDVMKEKPAQDDRMESFWLAETLKYFYLLYADVEVVSLDEFVLNTEAHPLRRPG
jgi:mannosyl-oligosaccharide alpha-1,2-mannosidase